MIERWSHHVACERGRHYTFDMPTRLAMMLIAWVAFAAAIALPAAPVTAQQAGVLRLLVLEELITLDPQRMSWMADIRIANCLFEPLLVVKVPSLELEPGAAERWEVSDDGLTYTFHLRPEAKWSNGDPLTAHDYIYAWRRAMLPDLAADYSQLLFRIDGAEKFFKWRTEQLAAMSKVGGATTAQQLWEQTEAEFLRTVGLQAPDDKTLVVKLVQPTPYFLQLVSFATFMPVHRKSVAALTQLDPVTGVVKQNSEWTKPENLVTNGPYKLDRWRFKRDLQLSVNPHYWNRGAMKNSGISQEYMPDLQPALLTYQRGKADWIPDIPTAHPLAADLVTQRRPDTHVTPAAGTYFYNLNCNPKLNDGSPNPLHDPRVRRALSMGIDRTLIVQKVTRLRQPEAVTFVPPQAIAHYPSPVEVGVTHNVEQARKLLIEAGYPEGRGLTGLSILYNTEGGHESIAQQIKNAWATNLGVTVTLEGVEKLTFGQRLKTQNYTISRASWFGDYRDPTTFLDKYHSGNGNNDARYKNAEYDALLEAAAKQTDRDERMATLARAEAMMLADQPLAPIFHYAMISMFDPAKVKGLSPNAWGQYRLEQVEVK